MALNFPANPTVGQRYLNYVFNGVAWIVQASTLAEAPNTPLGYARDGATGVWVPESPNYNKFVNAFKEIDQANEGNSITVTNASLYPVDGFKAVVLSSSATGNAARAIGPFTPPAPGIGFPALVAVNVITAASSVGTGDGVFFQSLLEANELADTGFGTPGAQPLTVSFWALCAIGGTYFFSLRNGPTSNRSYVAPFTLTANVWQFVTITIPGDTNTNWTINGSGLGAIAQWAFAAGTALQTTINAWQTGNFVAGPGMSNAVIQTANTNCWLGPCKLEVGSKATPILRTSFQQELARCQRYYEKSQVPGAAPGGNVGAGNRQINWLASTAGAPAFMSFPFKVTKRATPTLTVYDGAGAAGALSYFVSSSGWLNNGVPPSAAANANMVSFQPSIAGALYYNTDWVADARL